MLTGTGFALSEIDRRLTQVIRLGRVVEVDAEKARVRVQVGENTTGERPWVTCAGAIKIWNPPAVGEQVVLLSPGGDLDQSIVLPSLYYRSFAAPSQDPNAVQVQLSEKTTALWNPTANTFSFSLSPEGHIELKSGDLSAYFDSREVTFLATDTSFCFEEGGMTLKYLTSQITVDLNEVCIQSHGSEILLKEGKVQIRVGPQNLELNAEGLFLNGRPL